jgi:hypothetical protein
VNLIAFPLRLRAALLVADRPFYRRFFSTEGKEDNEGVVRTRNAAPDGADEVPSKSMIPFCEFSPFGARRDTLRSQRFSQLDIRPRSPILIA